MIPTPTALSLTLCDAVIIEERTKKVSLIGGFAGMRVERFPALAMPFSAFAIVSDGLGDGTITLSVVREDTGEEVYLREMEYRFPNRLAEVRVHFRLTSCIFPTSGWYRFTLLIDREWVAHRRLRVYSPEDHT
jgi:hypothetical protein